jgi:uncharacterized membrane protein YeaQ/YmgE (transglycosylase-associated protein family)
MAALIGGGMQRNAVCTIVHGVIGAVIGHALVRTVPEITMPLESKGTADLIVARPETRHNIADT